MCYGTEVPSMKQHQTRVVHVLWYSGPFNETTPNESCPCAMVQWSLQWNNTKRELSMCHGTVVPSMKQHQTRVVHVLWYSGPFNERTPNESCPCAMVQWSLQWGDTKRELSMCYGTVVPSMRGHQTRVVHVLWYRGLFNERTPNESWKWHFWIISGPVLSFNIYMSLQWGTYIMHLMLVTSNIRTFLWVSFNHRDDCVTNVLIHLQILY